MEVRSKSELVSEISSLRSKSVNEDEEKIFNVLKKSSIFGNDKPRYKKELDNIGFDRNRLGNYLMPHLGYVVYYFLYSDWTVPSE
jgi:hypothetical protein